MSAFQCILSWLERPIFRFWGAPLSIAELIGDVTGALCIWLLGQQHILSWPLALANATMFGLIFWRAKLYGNAALQGFYFVISAYGWWHWLHGGKDAGPLRVRRFRRNESAIVFVVTVLSFIAIALYLKHRTDSPIPLRDAAVVVFSVAGIWAQAKKIVGCWWLWMTSDVISVFLCLGRGLYPTAGLYVVYLLLCVHSLRAWTADLSAQEEAAQGSASK